MQPFCLSAHSAALAVYLHGAVLIVPRVQEPRGRQVRADRRPGSRVGGTHGPSLLDGRFGAGRTVCCMARRDLRRLRACRRQGDSSRGLQGLHPRGALRRGGAHRHPALRAADKAQQPAHRAARQGLLLSSAHSSRPSERHPARHHASLERRAGRDLLRHRAVRASSAWARSAPSIWRYRATNSRAASRASRFRFPRPSTARAAWGE